MFIKSENFYRWVYPLIFLIPLNIFVIGGGFGFGVQWAFLRYQSTGLGTSCIPIWKSVEYVLDGTLTGRSALSELVLFLAVVLLIASFILLQLYSGDLKLPGILTIVGGIFIIIADMLQVGIGLSGMAGTYIPIGAPLVMLFGILLYLPEEDRAALRDSPEIWKYLFYATGIILIVLNANLILSAVSDPNNGCDYQIYLGVAGAVNDGKDPYDAGIVSRFIPGTPNLVWGYGYPPYTLGLFTTIAALVAIVGSRLVYYFLFVLMLLTVAVLLIKSDKTPDYPLLAILIITEFMGVFWCFLTGNFALIYLLFTSLVFFFLARNRSAISAVIMGIFATFSIFPVVFNAIYLAGRQSLKDRAKYIMVSLGVSAAILLISYLMNPALFISFVRLISGEGSPAYEHGGFNTPTPYAFIATAIPGLEYGGDLVFIGIILAITILYLRREDIDPMVAYSFLFMAIFLLMPRARAYYFAMLVVPLYFLLKGRSFSIKWVALMIAGFFPVLSFLMYSENLFIQYSQVIWLFVFFLFIGLIKKH